MTKYFNAKICDKDGNEINNDLNSYKKMEDYFKSNNVINTKVDLIEDNEIKAKAVFDEIVKKEINCIEKIRGGKIRSRKAKIIKKSTIKKYKNTRIQKSKKNNMI
jgi:hypothetical protein